MCGIAGYIAADGIAPDRRIAATMCDRIRHRGPDGFGYFVDGRVALGHRRLSIIDLSGGSQPLGNEDGSVQVVFNGEIYDYLELRRELIAKGHEFRTQSDTEVLVHLYEEAGERMAERLNGMFAFAIWDSRRQTLFLARDRFGKKPLYYTTAAPGAKLAFASELKALTVLPGFQPKVSARAVAEFLSLSYVPDPHTIYEGVWKLPPASWMSFGPDGMRQGRYWAPVFPEQREQDFGRSVDELRSVAHDAVARRMIADVPLGAFLSGGVDSGAVVAWMAECAPGNVKTFSIGFTDKRFDELKYARQVVERYHTDHREEVVTPLIQDTLDVLAKHFDEPFGDPSAIPMLYLARMTRQHVTVALSGDGADELFGGYRRYYFGALEERLREKMPRWFRRSALAFAGRYYPKFDYLPQVFRARTMLQNLSRDIGDAYFTSMSSFRDDGLAAALSPELRRELGGFDPRESFRSRFGAVSHLHPLEQMLAVDYETYLPGDILVKADRATMAYSLEGRSPMLDYRLGELAFRLPPGWKIHGRERKHILKQAVQRDLPAELIHRPKMGFAPPLAMWFRTALKPAFQALVLNPEMEQFLSPGEARRLWGEHQSGIANHDRKLWNLLVLGCWHATHVRQQEKLLAEHAV
jgi:asparagine synthase (glutamine-hydrolysing)